MLAYAATPDLIVEMSASGTYYGQQDGQNDGGACAFGKSFSNSLVSFELTLPEQHYCKNCEEELKSSALANSAYAGLFGQRAYSPKHSKEISNDVTGQYMSSLATEAALSPIRV